MIRFSHSFNTDLVGVGRLLKISAPLHWITKQEHLRLDHIYWDGNFIQVHAEITDKTTYQEPNAINILNKYRVFEK